MVKDNNYKSSAVNCQPVSLCRKVNESFLTTFGHTVILSFDLSTSASNQIILVLNCNKAVMLKLLVYDHI